MKPLQKNFHDEQDQLITQHYEECLKYERQNLENRNHFENLIHFQILFANKNLERIENEFVEKSWNMKVRFLFKIDGIQEAADQKKLEIFNTIQGIFEQLRYNWDDKKRESYYESFRRVKKEEVVILKDKKMIKEQEVSEKKLKFY